MDAHTGIIIAFSLLLSFFFSGIEIAFLSANRLHIELKRKQGAVWARLMSYFVKNKTWFIGTVLAGNTWALVIFGIFTAGVLNPMVETWFPEGMGSEVLELTASTLISTLLILIFAEFLPKSLFLLNPNVMLAAFAVPFQIMYYIFFPFTFTVVKLSRWLIKVLLRIRFSEELPTFELADLNHFLSNTRYVKHENEEIEINRKIFSNALAFRTAKLRDCMTTRTDIAAVDIADGMQNLKDAFIRSGHSKIVVYQDDINNVLGYCHQAALFKKPERIEDILTPAAPVQETMMAQALFVQLIKEHKSLAAVVDEFGETSGIVTLEDLMEEIFGEIEDEHDRQELLAVKLEENTYKLSARLEIEYINERFQLQLP
ncbi:MAG: hemolysin, partial [Candidatus Nephrothrix sp. EaCA]